MRTTSCKRLRREKPNKKLLKIDSLWMIKTTINYHFINILFIPFTGKDITPTQWSLIHITSLPSFCSDKRNILQCYRTVSVWVLYAVWVSLKSRNFCRNFPPDSDSFARYLLLLFVGALVFNLSCSFVTPYYYIKCYF